MTVICWDGHTLAADKRMLSGRTCGTTTKIFRLRGELVGFTGTPAAGMELMHWYGAGADPAKFPQSNRDPDKCSSLMIVKADRTVLEFQNTPHAFKHDDKCTAFGCGDEAAIVAMACGKTAAEAVELASRYNNGCGGGIDTLTLDPEP